MKLPQKAGDSAASGAIDRTACIWTHARTGRGSHADTRGTGTNTRRYTHTRGACSRSGGPHGRTTHATSGNASGSAIRRCQGREASSRPPAAEISAVKIVMSRPMALPGLEAPSWQPFWPSGISGNGSTTWPVDDAHLLQPVVLLMQLV